MRLSALLLMVPLSAAMAETPTVMDAYALANESNAAWSDKYAAGDVSGVAATYAGNALVVPPASAPISGKEAISDYWRQRLADGQQIFVRVESAAMRGDSLVESGVWSVQVTNVYGQRAYGGGEFKRILDRQQDGSFRIRLETWDVSSEAAHDQRVSMN